MNNEEFTAHELKALYKLTKEHEENTLLSEKEIYNEFYDVYEEPISKVVIIPILKKIAKYLPAEEIEEINKDFLRRKYHTFNNFVDQKVWTTLRKALEQAKTVEIEYFTTDSADFKKRRIDPYYASSRYTLGYCHLRKGIRKFRTSRIKSARLTPATFKIPDSFDKNDY